MRNSSKKVRCCLTQDYAEERSKSVSNVAYQIELSLADESEVYSGKVLIQFDFSHQGDDLSIVSEGQMLYLEYAGSSIKQLVINSEEVEFASLQWVDNFIALDAAKLKRKKNTIEVSFQSQFENDDFGLKKVVDRQSPYNILGNQVMIYTVFPTNNAHRVFPCFD